LRQELIDVRKYKCSFFLFSEEKKGGTLKSEAYLHLEEIYEDLVELKGDIFILDFPDEFKYIQKNQSDV
jgi:hypothetical protein